MSLTLLTELFSYFKRRMWPEKDVFGSSDVTLEEETTALHQICLADLSCKEINLSALGYILIPGY